MVKSYTWNLVGIHYIRYNKKGLPITVAPSTFYTQMHKPVETYLFSQDTFYVLNHKVDWITPFYVSISIILPFATGENCLIFQV